MAPVRLPLTVFVCVCFMFLHCVLVQLIIVKQYSHGSNTVAAHCVCVCVCAHVCVYVCVCDLKFSIVYSFSS